MLEWKRELVENAERQRQAHRVNSEAIERDRERLRDEAERRRRETLDALAQSFEEQVGGVVRALTTLAGTVKADGLVRFAQEMNGRTSAVATASAETSANVETTAAAAEELSASIDEIIGAQVAKSAAIAREAVERSRETNAKGRVGTAGECQDFRVKAVFIRPA